MRSSSRDPESSNTQSSTLVAFAEKRAKLTPSPFQVAPRGKGRPSRNRDFRSAGILALWVLESMVASRVYAISTGANGIAHVPCKFLRRLINFTRRYRNAH